MRKRTGLAALGLCAGLVVAVSGCTPPGSSSSLQREVDTLKMEVADLKDKSRLSDMRGGGSSYAGNENLNLQVQRLTEEIQAAGMGGLTLRQQLEYIGSRLDRLEKKAGLAHLDTSVVGSSAPIPVVGGPPVVAGQPAPVPVPVPVAGGYGDQTGDPYAGGGAATPASAPAASGPYEQGKSLFDQKQYGPAISQFRAQLSSTPKGDKAAASQFYIGESLYAQQQYEEAILEYQKVVTGFPKSSQMPTALLKQGLSFQAINEPGSAKLLYQKVVRDYPKSYAAGVAKERLKTIN